MSKTLKAVSDGHMSRVGRRMVLLQERADLQRHLPCRVRVGLTDRDLMPWLKSLGLFSVDVG